jgi:hypothetical protein
MAIWVIAVFVLHHASASHRLKTKQHAENAQAAAEVLGNAGCDVSVTTPITPMHWRPTTPEFYPA